jgi:hypothetical protein
MSTPGPTPTRDAGFGPQALAVSGTHACSVVDGALTCAGAVVDGLPEVVDVALGTTATCVRTRSTDVYCGSRARPAPTTWTPITTGATSLTAGSHHACALRRDGRVACWGASGLGQRGVVGDTGSDEPALVPFITGARRLTAGERHTCAVLANASVWCWGAGEAGQIDPQVLDPTLTPRAAALPRARDVSAGARHTCVIALDSTVHCIGDVGPAPATVRDPVALTGGESAACALSADGVVQCWGPSIPDDAPVRAGVAVDAAEIATGRDRTCVRRRSGEVRCTATADVGR